MASLPTVLIFTMCWKCDLICRPCKWQMVESVNSYMMGDDVQIRTLSYKEYSELRLEDVWVGGCIPARQADRLRVAPPRSHLAQRATHPRCQHDPRS